MSGQRGTQRRNVNFGGQRQHFVTERAIKVERGQRNIRLRQIHFVQCEQHRDFSVFRGCQTAVKQMTVQGRHRQYDNDARHVGGDQFLALNIGAVKQRSTRLDDFNHALLGRGHGDLHAIATGDIGAFAARRTGNQ